MEYRTAAGKLHRTDGPAVIHPNGHKEWWINDKLHREDGPAWIHPNGAEEWWLHNFCYEFELYINKMYPNDCPEKTMFLLKWS